MSHVIQSKLDKRELGELEGLTFFLQPYRYIGTMHITPNKTMYIYYIHFKGSPVLLRSAILRALLLDLGNTISRS